MNDIGAAIVFGMLALLLLFMGSRRGFFKFEQHPWPVPVNLFHLLGAFTIYFLGSALLPKLALTFWKKEIMLNYMSYASWLNFSLSFLIFFGLAIYFLCLPARLRSGILRRSAEKHPLIEDVWTAFYAWIIAFPLVLFLSQTLEYLLTNIFKITQLPEQIAVKFLKTTFTNPLFFILAIISIVILAPLIEELLFRGFLQSYIRQHLGPRQAIVITSICFAFFHYAAGQGLGNISIIISLFILALFLGFLYEKQGSLLAPMVLHACFNSVSVINLYFFEANTLGI